jgi:hypothetical protein
MALSFTCPRDVASKKEQANEPDATARAPHARNRAETRTITDAQVTAIGSDAVRSAFLVRGRNSGDASDLRRRNESQIDRAISPIASFSARFFARINSLVAALAIMPFLSVPTFGVIAPDILGDRNG